MYTRGHQACQATCLGGAWTIGGAVTDRQRSCCGAEFFLGARGGQTRQRALDVGVHCLLCSVGFAREQRLEQQRMRVGDELQIALTGVVAAGVDDEAARVHADRSQHLQQQPMLRAGIDHVVKLEVQSDEIVRRAASGGGAHVPDQLAQALEVGRGQMLHRQPRRQSLQLGADVLDRDRVLERDARDEGSAVRQAGQQTLALERADRFAHGLSTHPKTSGELDFEDAFAWLEPTVDDLVAQRVGNIVAQRAPADQGDGCIDHSFDTASAKLYTRLHLGGQGRAAVETWSDSSMIWPTTLHAWRRTWR